MTKEVGKMYWMIPIVLCVILAVVLVGVIVYFPEPSSEDLLVDFEAENLAGVTCVRVAAIRSGDVAIRLSIPDFLESCVNKTVYRYYNDLTIQDSARYVFFVQGSDEELVEYYFYLRYVPVFPWGLQWQEIV